ncbi:Pyruvate dehydrogenase complex component Pdx1 [Penicillium brevicompactum]|uniref:Pyruvate dehydrogenase complex component Pdx1 n=1 Tax=Penicillium brevicompactum TaxID=5074 RepID=A0A9W9RCU2_PENBR|nr:Pyruvate dehydrogenase complex component Pdx1 [Penicillium brevicompactum]
MAAKISVGQVPAMFARRQQQAFGVGRRLQSTSSQTQNPAYPLYPSVAQLLREKGIPKSDVSKIPASGPKGRLLKGDVLAYIGQIASDYPATQAATLAKLAHLDLSNIKLAPAPAPAAPAAVEEKPVAAPPVMTSVAISISLSAVLSAQKKLQDNLGVTVPLSRFLAIATDIANDDLPRLASFKPSADELFDEVLGAEPTVRSKPVTEDLIDFLSAKPSKKAAPAAYVETASGAASNVFSLTVPVDEQVRAKEFLERIKTLLSVEPARLVL